MSQGSDQVISVRLRRGATSTPWGFRMQGGHEYGSPLYIQQVNPKSLSMRQGLRIGDRLLAIGSIQAHNMSHEQAKMEIIRAGNELDLIVQRNASAVIDQPDSRPQVARRNVEAYEEPTEYMGYTNPNVQSRSFKILQESLSYSEADEEGIVLPTGHTPGEGIVRKAYSEGRRRLEELSEINPRNFTADGQSPYRFTEHYLIQEQSNISPDAPDGEGRQRRQPESSSTVVASRVYDGKAVGGEARARPQVDLANSSVLSPAAGQQQYLQQAKKHYHEYYQDDYEKAIPQPQPAPVVHSQPVVRNVQQQQQRTDGGRPLKLVNYHFEEQYGHMRDPQAGGRQKAVVSPQKSNDFIPATQTVSSVAADLDLKIISPDAESNMAPMGQGTVVYHQQQQQPAQVVTQTQTKRVRQRTRGGNTAQSSTNVVVTSVTQQAQVPVTTQLDTTDGCSMSKSTATAPGPVVQAPSVQQTTVVQQRTVTQEATQQGPVVQVVAQSAPAPQAQTTQVQTTQVVAQPAPVVQEVKQTTTTVTQVEQQPGSVSEKVEQTTSVTKVVEQQSATVVQEVKQASPEKQVVEQPAPVTQEVVQEEKQAAPEAQVVEQPAPVVEEVKQAPAGTQQVVEQPTPVVEEVKAPEPEPQVVEQPAPVPVQPEQPAPIPEATPVQQVAEQVSASIVQEAIEVVSTQATEQPKEETPSQPQVSETAKTEESQQVTVAIAEEKVVVEQPEADTKAGETVEVSATTSNESQSVTIEATQVTEQSPAASDATVSVQAEDSKTEETVVVQETTTILADTSAEAVDETVSFAISTDASTEQDASESVSIALDTSANSEETITISDNSANFEISGGDAEFSVNLSNDVTVSTDAGNTESEETTIILNSDSTTETVDISADTAVSLSISSDVTITADEPTESATITVAQTKDESKSAEGANVTIALEETKSSESESESKTKKDKPMGQKLLEQRKNDQRNSKPAKVKIVDSQGGVAARLARLKQK